MDLSYKQEITVGSLVILAIALFVVGTTWLAGRSVGVNKDRFWHIQFRDVGGLKASSAVRISGVPAGRVEEITLLDAGKVLVAISLDEGIVPKIDATAQIVSIGFVGDAAIDFNPGKAAEPLPKNHTIIGTQAQGLSTRAEQLGDRADSVLLGVQTIVNKRTADELYETMKVLRGMLVVTQQTMGAYRTLPTALTETMEALRQLSARLDTTLANPALAHTLSHTDTLMMKLTAVTARFDSTVAAINRGQGTIGKFVTDSSLYYNMRDATQSLKGLLDELTKHPGKISVTIKPF